MKKLTIFSIFNILSFLLIKLKFNFHFSLIHYPTNIQDTISLFRFFQIPLLGNTGKIGLNSSFFSILGKFPLMLIKSKTAVLNLSGSVSNRIKRKTMTI